MESKSNRGIGMDGVLLVGSRDTMVGNVGITLIKIMSIINVEFPTVAKATDAEFFEVEAVDEEEEDSVGVDMDVVSISSNHRTIGMAKLFHSVHIAPIAHRGSNILSNAAQYKLPSLKPTR